MASDSVGSTAGRVLWAGLNLLDRQLVDRNKVRCGNVDDLELERSEDTGTLYVRAIITGPGALAYRLRWRRLGRWLQEVNRHMWGGRGDAVDRDPNLIDMQLVTNIGDHIELAAEREEIGTWSLDDWTARHIIGHIPGSSHEAKPS